MELVSLNQQAVESAANQLSTRNQTLLLASALEIKSDDDAEVATDLCKQINVAIKKVEEERKSLTKPINDAVSAINAKFKTLTDPLNKANLSLRGKLAEWLEYKNALAREERRKQEEAARLAAQSAPQESAPVLVMPPKKAVAHGASASAGLRSVWDWELTDKLALMTQRPDLFIVNKPAIDALVSQGVRELPGVNIYERKNLVVR